MIQFNEKPNRNKDKFFFLFFTFFYLHVPVGKGLLDLVKVNKSIKFNRILDEEVCLSLPLVVGSAITLNSMEPNLVSLQQSSESCFAKIGLAHLSKRIKGKVMV
jgi:hypothetical protein